jgi:hypothetical protein
MFAPPPFSMLPVFPNNHSEVNAGTLIARFARPVQAKHHFTNFVAAFPELFAAIWIVLPQFLRNDLGASGRRRAENHQQSKQSESLHVKASTFLQSGVWPDFESKFGPDSEQEDALGDLGAAEPRWSAIFESINAAVEILWRGATAT